MEQDPDVPVAPPAKPTQPGQTVVWFDTGDGGTFLRHGGLIGVVVFDEDVHLVVKRAPLNTGDAGLRVMSDETVTANTVRDVAVPFVGARTRVEIVTQSECDVWHVDGRITTRKWWP